MNILTHLRGIDTPDPRAVAMGLTVERLGRGRYRYSGRPRYMAEYVRCLPDAGDLAVLVAAGVPVDARTRAEALARGERPTRPATDGTRARCWTCGVWYPHIAWYEVEPGQTLQCWTCWLNSPLPSVTGQPSAPERPTVDHTTVYAGGR